MAAYFKALHPPNVGWAWAYIFKFRSLG